MLEAVPKAIELWDGDLLEVSDVAGQDGVSVIDGSGSDHEIADRQHIALRRFLTFYLTDKPRGPVRNRVNRNQADKFLNVPVAALSRLRRLRTIDAVHEFGDGHRR